MIIITHELPFWLAVFCVAFLESLDGFGGAAEIAGSAPLFMVWLLMTPLSALLYGGAQLLPALFTRRGCALFLHRAGVSTWLTPGARPYSRLGQLGAMLLGPLTAFAIAALAALLRDAAPIESVLVLEGLRALFVVSLILGLCNLLPILPFDAARLLAAWFGPVAALGLSALFSGLLAAAGLVWAFLTGNSSALMGGAALSVVTVLYLLRRRAYASGRGGAAPAQAGAAQTETLAGALEEGWRRLASGDQAGASRAAGQVLGLAQEPSERNSARDLLAWSALARAEAGEARAALERCEPPEAARALTSALVLEAQGESAEALPHAYRAIAQEPCDTSANLLVRLLAEERRFDEALALCEQFQWIRAVARTVAFAELELARGEPAAASRRFEALMGEGGEGRAIDAYNAACLFGRRAEGALAFEWLRRAVDAGFSDRAWVERDPDLALLRSEGGQARIEALFSPVEGAVPRGPGGGVGGSAA